MSHVIEQAEELRKRAIELLLAERTAIDERLAMLSHEGGEPATTFKRRVCGTCGSTDHNARRCPRNAAEAAADSPPPIPTPE